MPPNGSRKKLSPKTAGPLLAPAKEEAAIPKPGAQPQRPTRVLVMDDDYFMRLAVGSALESRGFEVAAASDGLEALALYSKAKDQGFLFDAVILDLTVRGGIGGAETLQALLKINPAVKAIVMSGYSDDPVLVHPERHGFKAGMEKSFDVDQLTATITRIIQS